MSSIYTDLIHHPRGIRVSVKSHERGGEMTSDLSMRCFHYRFHDLSYNDYMLHKSFSTHGSGVVA